MNFFRSLCTVDVLQENHEKLKILSFFHIAINDESSQSVEYAEWTWLIIKHLQIITKNFIISNGTCIYLLERKIQIQKYLHKVFLPLKPDSFPAILDFKITAYSEVFHWNSLKFGIIRIDCFCCELNSVYLVFYSIEKNNIVLIQKESSSGPYYKKMLIELVYYLFEN